MSAVLIVDAFSTGRYLAGRFRSLVPDIKVCHLQSSDFIPNGIAGFDPADFDHILGVYHTAKLLADALGDLSIKHVVAGSETGVALASQLAAQADCKTRNDERLSGCRRHKFDMQKRIEALGIPSAKTFLVSSLAEAGRLLSDRKLSLPVVVKPPKSAGTDGVSICNDERQVTNAISGLLRKRDKLNNLNRSVVIQEFLEGEEYCVSAVSVGGEHYFTDVWRYRKKNIGVTSVYDCDELLAVDDVHLAELLSYVRSVLDAVGTKFGPSHTEVMLTPRGPRLIETACRLQGGVHPDALTSALGHDPIALAAMTFVCPTKLADINWINLGGARVLQRKAALLCVHLIADTPGHLNLPFVNDYLESLDSYYRGSFHPSCETPFAVSKTVDMFSSPGFCYLLAGNGHLVWSDYSSFRDAEQRFYRA